jgi:CheY-like chemotaxis protein
MGDIISMKQDHNPIILVVDDDPYQRREIVRCITDLGIRTHEEDNGRNAVESILTLHPVLVIMDIKMPVLDGVDAAKMLTELDNYRPKVLLITGDPDSLYRANRLGLDIFGVIEKPIPISALIRFVTNAINDQHTNT